MKNDYKDVFKCIYFGRGKRKLSCVRFCAGILVVINKQSADRLQTPPPPMSELGLTIAIFTCYIICVSIILEYTMTRQLGSSVLSIYK